MPRLLIEFLAEFGAEKKGEVDFLLDKMYQNSPEVTQTSELKSYSAKYKELPKRSQQQKALDAIWDHLINTQPAWLDPKKLTKFLEESITPQQNVLILKAFKFESSNVGNCSHRACYAAIRLHEMFRATSIEVMVKSSKEIDHFVVYLKNKVEKTWFVYDPLTNPEVVFAFDEYQKEIIPAFKPASTQVLLSISVTIDDDFCQRYARLYPKLLKHLSAEVDALNVKKLQSIPGFTKAVSVYCEEPHPKKLLELACAELKVKFGKKSLSLTQELCDGEATAAASDISVRPR